ncbi:MAG: hypothetical protein ACKOQY_06925 [Bacteroidota bacterium]
MIPRFLSIVTLWLASFSALCQPYTDLISVQAQYLPTTKVIQKPDSLEPEITSWQISATVPLYRGPGMLIVCSPAFERRVLNTDYGTGEMPAGESPFASRNFSNRSLVSTIRLNLKDSGLRLVTAFVGRYFSEEGEGLQAARFTPGLACYAEKRFNEKLMLRAGLYLSREYYGGLWLPLLGWDWRISDRIHTWALLPRYAVVDWRALPRWHVCLHFRGINDSYGIGTVDQSGWIAMQEGHLRLGQEYYVPGTSLVIAADAGISLNRQWWGAYPASSEETRIKPAENLIFRVGLAWRIITDKRFER